MGLVVCSFAGGAVVATHASATTQRESPYAPFDQLSRVLVLVENEYVDPASRNKILDGAIKGMVAELDPHSAYMPKTDYALFQGETEGKFAGIGVEIDAREDVVTIVAPIEGSPAARAGIKSGDQIVSIDGKLMRGERLDKLVSSMRGPPGSRVHLVVRRPKVADPIAFDLVREEIHVASVLAKRLDHDVAYVRLKQFQEGTHEELLKAVKKLREESKDKIAGVVLDMRSNPGGLVDEAEAVADEFLSSGIIYTTRHRDKIVDKVEAHDGGAFADVPVTVLVNEFSASSAELVAGALQDQKRALVVGQTTFGKGSVQTIFDLPDGAGLRLTTMRYYTPSGRSIQAQGITPDVAIDAGRDDDPELVRERNLEGHLAGDAPIEKAKSEVLKDPNAKKDPATLPPMPPQAAADIPSDPTKGQDFALKIGFERVLAMVSAKK